MAYTVWLGVISCSHSPAPPAPRAVVGTPCVTTRVGQVLVTGAAKSDVPALAVLEGTIDDSIRTERVVAAAVESLQSRGYARAAITVTREARCFTDLHVAVTLGPRFKIGKIEFATDDAFPARERLAAIEDALGTVERRYHDAGWLEAKVAAPTVHLEDGRVDIQIPITAGPRFRIGAIRARGAGPAARAAVLDEIHLEPGAWYDGPAIRTGIERARRKLDRWVELRTNLSSDRGEIELEAILESRP